MMKDEGIRSVYSGVYKVAKFGINSSPRGYLFTYKCSGFRTLYGKKRTSYLVN